MSGREIEVLNYINVGKFARTDQLSRELGISESTVRRILERLERQNKIIRFHGGASAISEETPQTGLAQRISSSAKAKDRIAQVAAARVKSGMSIVLLGGTTISYMCKYLKGKKLTVITNSLLVLDALKYEPNIKLVLLGGVYDAEEAEVRGSITNNAIQQLGADCLFSSATAFDRERGFLTTHLNSTEFYRQCFGSAKKIYMLVDSEKYNKPALAVSAHFSEVNCVVTDDGLPAGMIERMKTAGIEVLVIKEGSIPFDILYEEDSYERGN